MSCQLSFFTIEIGRKIRLRDSIEHIQTEPNECQRWNWRGDMDRRKWHQLGLLLFLLCRFFRHRCVVLSFASSLSFNSILIIVLIHIDNIRNYLVLLLSLSLSFANPQIKTDFPGDHLRWTRSFDLIHKTTDLSLSVCLLLSGHLMSSRCSITIHFLRYSHWDLLFPFSFCSLSSFFASFSPLNTFGCFNTEIIVVCFRLLNFSRLLLTVPRVLFQGRRKKAKWRRTHTDCLCVLEWEIKSSIVVSVILWAHSRLSRVFLSFSLPPFVSRSHLFIIHSFAPSKKTEERRERAKRELCRTGYCPRETTR